MKMAKTALYTVGARINKETIQRIDRNKKDTETRSEIINKAIIYYLDALENPENQDKNTAASILDNPELIDKLSEILLLKLQNQTFTIMKK